MSQTVWLKIWKVESLEVDLLKAVGLDSIGASLFKILYSHLNDTN